MCDQIDKDMKETCDTFLINRKTWFLIKLYHVLHFNMPLVHVPVVHQQSRYLHKDNKLH